MPTYDYKCENCGHQFETLQSIKAEPLTECPVCGNNTLKRLIGGGAGLIFKGSGFYLTDYKNTSAKTNSSNSTDKPDSKKPSETPSKTETAANTSKSE